MGQLFGKKENVEERIKEDTLNEIKGIFLRFDQNQDGVLDWRELDNVEENNFSSFEREDGAEKFVDISTAHDMSRKKKRQAKARAVSGSAKGSRALDMIKALQGQKDSIGLSDIFKADVSSIDVDDDRHQSLAQEYDRKWNRAKGNGDQEFPDLAAWEKAFQTEWSRIEKSNTGYDTNLGKVAQVVLPGDGFDPEGTQLQSEIYNGMDARLWEYGDELEAHMPTIEEWDDYSQAEKAAKVEEMKNEWESRRNQAIEDLGGEEKLTSGFHSDAFLKQKEAWMKKEAAERSGSAELQSLGFDKLNLSDDAWAKLKLDEDQGLKEASPLDPAFRHAIQTHYDKGNAIPILREIMFNKN